MDTIFIDTQDKKNKSILVISDDLIYMDKLKKEVSLTFDFTFFENNKFYLLNSVINNFDVIIFDNSNNDLKKFLDVFKLTKSYNFNIPIILLEKDVKQDLSLYKIINVYSILQKPVSVEFLLNTIELCINFLNTNKKVQFENGYYFDITREELFHGKKIIKLTRTEKKLINLLAKNPNSLVTYEDIANVVWKGKVFSKYSLRNVINHIREKTDETFIRNYSNRGYILNSI
ncbi:MAG: helix-turn-helix domain-containing protein [Arcobacter sp.]|jgi:DNA-binding response OmpR family regulator|uniref:winged helix-turn-helix domain-containing protein n=1 Tax=Arcobacter sp. TaxID=1872629 RepID=UPI00258ACD83|nr:helix-turn-helix domain-containing protein [Arcobacter sp.]MDD3008121.1 helix-turn-helix domain-containing protein [Arcobacter sp.]MDY3204771.1 helix-turn-helix domain-containing protein [Arcobacter sp.]